MHTYPSGGWSQGRQRTPPPIEEIRNHYTANQANISQYPEHRPNEPRRSQNMGSDRDSKYGFMAKYKLKKKYCNNGQGEDER